MLRWDDVPVDLKQLLRSRLSSVLVVSIALWCSFLNRRQCQAIGCDHDLKRHSVPATSSTEELEAIISPPMNLFILSDGLIDYYLTRTLSSTYTPPLQNASTSIRLPKTIDASRTFPAKKNEEASLRQQTSLNIYQKATLSKPRKHMRQSDRLRKPSESVEVQ